jgi:hypothetical protein
MANPSLNSFLAPTQFNVEKAVSPIYAAFLAGSTYYPPVFTGVSGAAGTNPGGLFGWLIYARTQLASPAKGTTSDSYLVYNSAFDLVNDLNNLGGVTACLISGLTAEGGTFGFFRYTGNDLIGLTNGNDFLHALSYLAYGSSLVIAGACGGFTNYETDTSNKIDVLIGQNGSTSEARYVENTPQVIGIFASQSNGAGYTAIGFDGLFSSASYVTGTTVADRIFNVAGKNIRTVITSTLKENSTYKVSMPLISDVAGAFVRAKNNNNLYFSIAGLDNSTVLNGIVSTPVIWNDEATKNIYKKNRVNFYTVSNQRYFLGLDITGATTGASASYSSNDRIGPSKIRQDIETNVTNILLKYVFQPNNANTRASITSEISLYLFGLSQYLDTNYTQIFCDESNNTDYASTINVRVVVKPLISSEEFSLVVSTETNQ